MIELTRGNLLEAETEALVNTVNCVGAMGKGIALQFKQAFPDNFKAYQAACRASEVVPGKMFIHANGDLVNPRYIINFPTKRHWRGPSRLEDIESGLAALVADVQRLGIHSIAMPPLGCGLGGLDWRIVRSMIEQAFAALPQVRVLLFEPTGAPEAKAMPIRTERPKMTPARALFIKLMDAYAALDYRRTLLEVQKLAYFLQEAGEPLRLKYQAGHYGPYAANLNKVLEVMEGHYIRGCGDSQKPDAEIDLLPGAVEEAADFLADRPESLSRLERITDLIEGFETPYGMELLASVHWTAHRGGPNQERPAGNPEEALAHIHAWNPRKQRVFKPEHIRTAWQQLDQKDWMPARGEASSLEDGPKMLNYHGPTVTLEEMEAAIRKGAEDSL
ncbi:MAG: macro domain-containing protein [Candidatus Competibacteraceae bacterium]|nr:macro domain-containing protein [Candidatus Competibacteraceae bacterium]